jgi:hypothetical protein
MISGLLTAPVAGRIGLSRRAALSCIELSYYDGDRNRLDAELARGLQKVAPVAAERQQAKPRGKRRAFRGGAPS